MGNNILRLLLRVYGMTCVALVVILIAQNWFVMSPEEYAPADQLRVEFHNRQVIGQLVAGTLVLFGLYLTWRRMLAIERSSTTAEHSQITQSFNDAISQLGSKKTQGRMGGLYALERIMHNSEGDISAIAEVISRFVRIQSPYNRPTEEIGTQVEERESVDRRYVSAAKHSKLGEDVKSALNILGRRPNIESKLIRIFLHEADLSHAVCLEANFEEAEFWSSNLQFVNFWMANLRQASFWCSNLSDAHLVGGNFAGADFWGANLRNSELTYANLWAVDLREANLEGVNFEEAFLAMADLIGSKGVTVEQLLSANSLYKAKIDSSTKETLYKKKPRLFEKPARFDEIQGLHYTYATRFEYPFNGKAT